MTIDTSNAHGLSRQGRVCDPTFLSPTQSIFGKVVAHCKKQTDNGLKHWIQLQPPDGDLSWWPISRSDIALGQFLRVEVATGEASKLPVVLPEDVLVRLYKNCACPNDLDSLFWLIMGIQQVDLCVFMLEMSPSPCRW